MWLRLQSSEFWLRGLGLICFAFCLLSGVASVDLKVRLDLLYSSKQESVTHSRSHSSASSSILRNSLSDLVTKNSTFLVSGQASDSPEEVSAKRSLQKSVTLTEERHVRSDIGAGAAMIKSYLRQLSSSETSVLGQIVRWDWCSDGPNCKIELKTE